MQGNEIRKRLARNIKTFRKSRNMTQEALAEKIGMSFMTVNCIEGGRRFPSDATLAKIASALEVDVVELFIPAFSDGILAKIVGQALKAVQEKMNAAFDAERLKLI